MQDWVIVLPTHKKALDHFVQTLLVPLHNQLIRNV